MTTLHALSTLAGDVEVVTRSIGHTQGADGRLRGSMSTSTLTRRRLPPDAVARGIAGSALAIDPRRRMGWVRLTPAHRERPWREMIDQRSTAPDLFGRA